MARNFNFSALIPERDTVTLPDSDKALECLPAEEFNSKQTKQLSQLYKKITGDDEEQNIDAVDELVMMIIVNADKGVVEELSVVFKTQFVSWWFEGDEDEDVEDEDEEDLTPEEIKAQGEDSAN